MSITTAGLADIPELNILVNSAYRGDGSKKGWTTEADLLDGIRTSEESLKNMLKRPRAVVMLAEENNNLQGCVYLEQQGKDLYLGMLTVDPEQQGKGLGAALMTVSEKHA